MDKNQLRVKLSEILPLDAESLDQTINYSLTLPTNDEVANHFLGLMGHSPLVFEFIQALTDYKNQSGTSEVKYVKPPMGRRNESEKGGKKESKNAWQDTKLQKDDKSAAENSKILMKTTNNKKPAEPKKSSKAQKLVDIGELDNILRSLEYGDNNSKCDCMATRHGLNKSIPNCLSCGKIICLKESSRSTCSFCGAELISWNEKLEIIRLLQEEKDRLLSRQVPKKAVGGKKKQEKFTVSMGPGSKNFFKEQEKLYASLEKKNKSKPVVEKLQGDLVKAEANLNNLLGYQEDSQQRTKIIDQVSDYSILNDANNMWTSSSIEKIIEMKKQQRNLRKMEKLEAERRGRGKKFMALSLHDGKVTMTETRSGGDGEMQYDSDMEVSESDEELEKDIRELEGELLKEKKSEQSEVIKKGWDYAEDHQKWQDRKPHYEKGKIDPSKGEYTNESDNYKRSHIQREGTMEDLVLAI